MKTWICIHYTYTFINTYSYVLILMKGINIVLFFNCWFINKSKDQIKNMLIISDYYTTVKEKTLLPRGSGRSLLIYYFSGRQID